MLSTETDVGNVAYMIFFWLGLGNLFPWNTFITAASYFSSRFCGTSFEESFENFFSFSFTLSQSIGLAFAVRYQDAIEINTKVIYPLICYSAVFLATTSLVLIAIDGDLLFWLTLVSTCICGLCGAMLSGGLFGLAGFFPPKYTAALMTGQALAGLLVCVSNILTSLAGGEVDVCTDDNAADDGCSFEVSYSALSYFIIATLVLISCVVSFLALMRLPITKYYTSRKAVPTTDDGYVATDEAVYSPVITGSDYAEGEKNSKNSSWGSLQKEELYDGETGSLNKSLINRSSSDGYERIKSVLREIFTPALSVFGVFTVTIGIFPSIIVVIESQQQCSSSDRFYNDLFVPFMFLLFNLFDFLGRLTAGSTNLVFNERNIWIPTVARAVFIPLFLFCNISDSVLPVLFVGDVFPIVFMILMAFSNGYVASTAMMVGPSMVKPSDAPLAGTIMVFSLTLGLLGGACISFLLLFIATGHF